MLWISDRSGMLLTLGLGQVGLLCLRKNISVGSEDLIPHVKTGLGHDNFDWFEELAFRVPLKLSVRRRCDYRNSSRR